jgi:hypothetical protein
MKRCILVLILMIAGLVCNVLAENVLSLNVDNTWIYELKSGGTTYDVSFEVTGYEEYQGRNYAKMLVKVMIMGQVATQMYEYWCADDGEFDTIQIDQQTGQQIFDFYYDEAITETIPGEVEVLTEEINGNSYMIQKRYNAENANAYSKFAKNLGILYSVSGSGTTMSLTSATIDGVNYGNYVSIKESTVSEKIFTLQQNYPNPFNPETTINYTLTKNAQVELIIYNAKGQKVSELVNSVQTKGLHKAIFKALNRTSGVYYYQLFINNKPAGLKKMMLVK